MPKSRNNNLSPLRQWDFPGSYTAAPVNQLGGGSDFFRANEPVGMTLVDYRPFVTTQEHQAPYTPSWDTDDGATPGFPGYFQSTIISDPTAPHSPPECWRMTYPAGWVAGSSPGHAGCRPSGAGNQTVYVCFAAKLSSNWQLQNSSFTKHFYIWCNAGAGDQENFFLAAHGSPPAGVIDPYMMLQNCTTFPSLSGSPNGNWGPLLVPSTQLVRGQWHTYEVVLVGNTAGNADGSMDLWIDGVHCTSVGPGAPYGGIQWTSGGDCKFVLVALQPVWGGTGPPNVTADQTLDFAYLYWSGKN